MCVAGSLSSVGFVTGGFVVRASSFSSARFATAASRTTASSFGATLGATFFASSARAVESRASFPRVSRVSSRSPNALERGSDPRENRLCALSRGPEAPRFGGFAGSHPERAEERRQRRAQKIIRHARHRDGFAGVDASQDVRQVRADVGELREDALRGVHGVRVRGASRVRVCWMRRHRIHRSIHPTTRKKKKTKKKPRVPSETGSCSSFGACSSYRPSRACASCFSGRPCASCPCASWASSPGRRASSDSWRSSPSRATPPRPRGATRADAPGTPGSAPRCCSAPSRAAGGSPPCRAARARPH